MFTKKVFKWLAICSVMVSCAGCVSFYKAPQGGEVAILEMFSGSYAPIAVEHYKNEYCEKAEEGTRIAYVSSYADVFTKRIAVKNDFVITFDGPILTGPRCRKTVKFDPKAGATYRAIFNLVGAQCDVDIFRKEETKIGVVYSPEPSLKKLKHICTSLDSYVKSIPPTAEIAGKFVYDTALIIRKDFSYKGSVLPKGTYYPHHVIREDYVVYISNELITMNDGDFFKSKQKCRGGVAVNMLNPAKNARMVADNCHGSPTLGLGIPTLTDFEIVEVKNELD